MIASALLKPGDHIVVVRPNYATNIETPRAIGCDISFIDLKFEDGFRLDLGKVAAEPFVDTFKKRRRTNNVRRCSRAQRYLPGKRLAPRS